MKSYWIVAAAISLTWPSSSIACASAAQARNDETTVSKSQSSSSNSSATTPQNPVVAATGSAANPASAENKGSYMVVELSKTLKAKKLKPGDKIKAEVTQDVVSHGKVIIPVETKLMGHITEVSVRDKDNPESRLGIVFDRILLKHWHEINFQAVVQAVAPPVLRRSLVDEPSQMLPPSMVVGDLRQSTPTPTGRLGSSRGSSTPPPSTISQSNATDNYQVPLTVKQSPSTHAQTGGSAAQLVTQTPDGQPLSLGMPYGVTGLKGLSLSSSSTHDTPGPVVVSHTENVKLESGTQLLLHVLRVEIPQGLEK